MNDTLSHPSHWFMQVPLSCDAVTRVTRGQQQHDAFHSALYIYTSRLLSLLFCPSLSLCPNPLEALFAGDSHALSKTIRSEAERRESKKVESEWERLGMELLSLRTWLRLCVCALVLLALEALIWSGLAFPSHPLSLVLIRVDVGCYFTLSAQTRPCSLHLGARCIPFGTSCIPFFHLP